MFVTKLLNISRSYSVVMPLHAHAVSSRNNGNVSVLSGASAGSECNVNTIT